MTKKGFTMLELLIVIGIISILASIGFNSYTNVQRSARNNRRKADIKEIQTAIEAFRAERGTYPNTGGQWWGNVSGYGNHPRTGPNGYVPDLAPVYIPILPIDPRQGIANTANNAGCTATQTGYLYRSDGVNYKLIVYCSPEGILDPDDKFFDPRRPTFSWQVSSGGVAYTSW